MSKFFDALKRQVGRDTGKVISNTLYGNSHSTPYRTVNKDNGALRVKELEIKKEDLERKDLFLIDNAVISAVDQIISLEIPDNEKDIIKISRELEIQLKVNKWLPLYKGEISRIRNKYPDAVLKKYEQCVLEMKYLDLNNERLIEMNKTLKRYKKISFYQKHKLYIFGLMIILFILIIGTIGG